jgi:hypothetical protein
MKPILGAPQAWNMGFEMHSGFGAATRRAPRNRHLLLIKLDASETACQTTLKTLPHAPNGLRSSTGCPFEAPQNAASCTTVSTFRTAPDPSLGMSLPDFAGVNGMPPRSRCNFPSIVWPTDGHAIKVSMMQAACLLTARELPGASDGCTLETLWNEAWVGATECPFKS